MCGMPQTIEHLLFSCSYVKSFWRVLQSVFDIYLLVLKVTLELIITAIMIMKHWLVFLYTNSG